MEANTVNEIGLKEAELIEDKYGVTFNDIKSRRFVKHIAEARKQFVFLMYKKYCIEDIAFVTGRTKGQIYRIIRERSV